MAPVAQIEVHMAAVLVLATGQPVAPIRDVRLARNAQSVAEDTSYNVVVVGAGNAALSAALAAADQGASVLVVEAAPEYLRGGNTYFSGGLFRFAYDGLGDIVDLVPGLSTAEAAQIDVGSYPETAYRSDLMRVTQSRADPELADILVSRSYSTMRWLRERGVPWVLAYGRQAFERAGRMKFWGGLVVEAVGGGKGLSDRLLEVAERQGVQVLYETEASGLVAGEDGRTVGVALRDPKGQREVMAGAVVLACGGFEANAEMRARHLGPGWELAKVRGTQFNTGAGIQMALDAGAQRHAEIDVFDQPRGLQTPEALFGDHQHFPDHRYRPIDPLVALGGIGPKPEGSEG